MHADCAVELGREDPALELPWRSDDGATRYYDLKRHPDLVLQIPEVLSSPELSAFLTRVNAPRFPLQTAKCDLWFSTELLPEEDVFQATGKFVSYVDLIFAEDQTELQTELGECESGKHARLSASRFSFERHEKVAKNLCTLLQQAPEMEAAVELVIRRCYYHVDDHPERSQDGFCITTYISGFGEDETEARRRWAIALELLQNALVQEVESSL